MMIVNYSINPGRNNNEAIIEAAKANASRTVKVLLEDPRTDPSVGDNAIIKMLTMKDHNEDRSKIFQLLIDDPRVGNSLHEI